MPECFFTSSLKLLNFRAFSVDYYSSTLSYIAYVAELMLTLFQMKPSPSNPVVGPNQAFLSIKLFRTKIQHLVNKKSNNSFKQHLSLRDIKISLSKLFSSSALWCMSTLCAPRLLDTICNVITIIVLIFHYFFFSQPALKLFNHLQSGLLKELNVQVEKSNAQVRNPVFRDTIKRLHQNQFRNRSCPMSHFIAPCSHRMIFKIPIIVF